MTAAQATPTKPVSRREVFRRFLAEKRDPEPFYDALVDRSMHRFPFPLAGATVLDLGSGPGHFSKAMAEAGASVVAVERDEQSLPVAPLGCQAARATPSACHFGGHRSTACSARTCWNTHRNRTTSSQRSSGSCAPVAGHGSAGPTGTHRGAATPSHRCTTSVPSVVSPRIGACSGSRRVTTFPTRTCGRHRSARCSTRSAPDPGCGCSTRSLATTPHNVGSRVSPDSARSATWNCLLLIERKEASS